MWKFEILDTVVNLLSVFIFLVIAWLISSPAQLVSPTGASLKIVIVLKKMPKEVPLSVFSH